MERSPADPLEALEAALRGSDSDTRLFSFGVGCLHFGAKEDRFKGDASSHVSAVKSWLEQEPTISDVNIHDPERSWFTRRGIPYGLADGGQAFPAILGLQVDFNIDISEDQRRRIYPFEAASAPLKVHVSIRQSVGTPVAYFVPAVERRRPSNAVTLVWHVLRELIPGDAPFFSTCVDQRPRTSIAF
jgi:hypothetical protein